MKPILTWFYIIYMWYMFTSISIYLFCIHALNWNPIGINTDAGATFLLIFIAVMCLIVMCVVIQVREDNKKPYVCDVIVDELTGQRTSTIYTRQQYDKLN